jgi:hypothetical protein
MPSAPLSAAHLTVDIRRYADQYDELESMPASSSVGALLNRVQATGTMTPDPYYSKFLRTMRCPSTRKNM